MMDRSSSRSLDLSTRRIEIAKRRVADAARELAAAERDLANVEALDAATVHWIITEHLASIMHSMFAMDPA